MVPLQTVKSSFDYFETLYIKGLQSWVTFTFTGRSSVWMPPSSNVERDINRNSYLAFFQNIFRYNLKKTLRVVKKLHQH